MSWEGPSNGQATRTCKRTVLAKIRRTGTTWSEIKIMAVNMEECMNRMRIRRRIFPNRRVVAGPGRAAANT